MKQYREMIRAIKERGTHKPAARENMPGTTSLFGYQFRHNLADGFPALTTKKLYWKGVVVELLWFLSGDTNIKFLDQHGVRKMWHEDAYNYYKKIASKNTDSSWNAIYMAINEKGEREDWTDQTKATSFSIFTFDEFCQIIQDNTLEKLKQFYSAHDYTLGDCGMQYGKLWRDWQGVDREVIVLHKHNLTPQQVEEFKEQWQQALKSQKSPIFINSNTELKIEPLYHKFDQIKELIEGLKKNPMGRRHIITAWNPTTLDDMALNACHAMAQWNCRPLTIQQRVELNGGDFYQLFEKDLIDEFIKDTPQYYLDCQMYQRSADVFLGVPLNIASYALLTEILCKICNMVPGEMIYTYGDVHIYDDHQEALEEQLSREEKQLPKLIIDEFKTYGWSDDDCLTIFDYLPHNINHKGHLEEVFKLENYDPHPTIKAKLSTGLK